MYYASHVARVSQRNVSCRKAALSALDECGIPYRLAYESPSRAGLECAVNAGLAVTVVPKDLVTDDLRILQNTKSGFPALPILDTYVFATPSNRPPSVNAVLSLLKETIGREILFGRSTDRLMQTA